MTVKKQWGLFITGKRPGRAGLRVSGPGGRAVCPGREAGPGRVSGPRVRAVSGRGRAAQRPNPVIGFGLWFFRVSADQVTISKKLGIISPE
ncbi:MAG: hypothetical protein FWG40_03580 [Peptococcaceae bacterium]|nr:hypothetical protein [Peptococcaceae bacterium]